MPAGKVGTPEQAELPVYLFQIPTCFGLWALAVQGERSLHVSPRACCGCCEPTGQAYPRKESLKAGCGNIPATHICSLPDK